MMRNARRVRGKHLSSANIRRNGRYKIVPSKSGKTYDVDVRAGTCTCADYELTRKKCKHLFAVEYANKKNLGNTKLPKRPTYSQDWPSYNFAQCHEKEKALELLRELCDSIQQPPQHMGRPRAPLKDMAFAVTMKVFGTMSGRRTSCDLQDYLGKNLIEMAPHHATMSKYLNDDALTPVLQHLITQSAIPLKSLEQDFAVDSTGFASTTYDRWFDHKYGKPANQKQWLKLHITTGVLTNIITSAEVTDAWVHDSTQFETLVSRTAGKFKVRELSADKAYLSKGNLEVLKKYGAKPFIPFKSNTTGYGSPLWENMYHMFQYKRKEFLKHYHQRSNVESTIWMIKSKFGANIRSRTMTSMKNETLAKVLCHNLSVLVQSIYEFKISPEFSNLCKIIS